MSSRAKVDLGVGSTILTPNGTELVTRVSAFGYVSRCFDGTVHEHLWKELEPARAIRDGQVDSIVSSFATSWSRLSESARVQALNRQEIVLTILTGFARGDAGLARDGEPFWPFDPKTGCNFELRLAEMSKNLEFERSIDRQASRAKEAGKRHTGSVATASVRTLAAWCSAYKQDGLLGLVDKRKTRSVKDFATLHPDIKNIALAEISSFDGTKTLVNHEEIVRRIKLAVIENDTLDINAVPDKTLRAFVSHEMRRRGTTTRSNKSTTLRSVSHIASFPGLRPGQVVAIDVTRADNLVWNPWTAKAVSVEIFSAIDVATRVILALRVIPRSADSTDAALILYDILRPFSMAVAPDTVDDWRWAGVPENIGPLTAAIVEAENITGHRPATAAGTHTVPGVLPDSIRADNGSIFTSAQFLAVCERLQIHVLHSRGSRPTDNSFVERWHETLQRCLQQIAGHKGRNVGQRGTNAGKFATINGQATFNGNAPVLTARELERHIREFIVTDYHRSWHQGLNLVSGSPEHTEPGIRLSPIDLFDGMVHSTGRLTVLQRPDLIYDLLDQVWATIGHAGVEIKNLSYDCEALDEFRNMPEGTFAEGSRKALFYRDPRDISRLWFRHPQTDKIIEVPWRNSYWLRAPMTDSMVDVARKNIRAKEQLPPASPKMQSKLLEELNDLGSIERLRATNDLADWGPNKVFAADMRFSRSQTEHAEAATLTTMSPRTDRPTDNDTTHTHTSNTDQKPAQRATTADGFNLLGEWPDLT